MYASPHAVECIHSGPVGTSTKSPPSNTCVLVRINEVEGRGMPCIKMEKVYKMTRLQDVLMGNRKACILELYIYING